MRLISLRTENLSFTTGNWNDKRLGLIGQHVSEFLRNAPKTLIPLAFQRPNATALDVCREFLALFPRRDIYIFKTKSQEKWKTWHKLEDHQILGVIADGGRGLYRGCHWGSKTRFAVLDIDKNSQYHNQKSLLSIAQALRSVGLNLNLYRSSDGGGWHCYLFFSGWQKSSEVASTLKKWLRSLGYELKGGQLEVFPSGNALRLPLQPGFAWLDQNNCIIRKREKLSFDEALAFFLQDLEENAANWAEAKRRIESQLSYREAAAGSAGEEHQKAIANEGFDELFNYRLIPEQIEKARKYLASGLTEKGTRHEALYSIQHFLWHGDPFLGVPRLPGRKNAGRRYQFLRGWIEQNHNDKCSHINRGDWRTIEAHIYRVVNWQRADLPALSNYEPYKATERAQERLFELFMATGRIWEMSDLKKANDDREQEARNKIKRAVADCLQEGRQISRKTLEAISGCSPNTVRKHGDLWKHFAAGSGVLISGGLGAADGSCSANLFVSSRTNSLEVANIEIEETDKGLLDMQEQALGNEKQPCLLATGNVNNTVAASDYTEGKSLFILPYGAKRRPLGLVIDSSGQAGCVLDSLRCDRTGQTAKNSRQVTTEVPAAVHPIQSNYGVKHRLEQGPLLGFLVPSEGMDSGINGFLPASGSPPFIPHRFFCMGAPAQNLRQMGNPIAGFVYNSCTPGRSKLWLSRKARTPKLDGTKSLAVPVGQAFGSVPLSCYDKLRQCAGGPSNQKGYIACMSSEAHEPKSEDLNRSFERQSEHVRQAQGEAISATENYTDQVKAQNQEQKVTGKSKATGAGADASGKGGLASAKDLLGDFAHATLTKDAKKTLTPERKAELMAEIERDGYIVGKPQDKPVLVAQGFNIPNPVDTYKREFEHKYRGRELETINRDIPAKAWDEAYKAFPELKQLGQKDSIRLMKAIIANELDHYGPEDVTQDEVAKTGHGGGIVGTQSIGFAQIRPDGVRNMSRAFSHELAEGKRTSNPLQRFEKMNNDQLTKELTNPSNAPLFVAAHLARDLQILNRHKNELSVSPEGLGYWYNADRAYAKTDTKHEHLLVRKKADSAGVPNVPALPTEEVLKQSEHAANIRKWLGKIH
ncbi:MAG TPA: hypothetical protein PL112_18080 [Candidatus Obscuribacter sp.]|nr:hypothetical protein [Candidatus Obscuribacter sp.]HND68718.1 hypothetical protein [Candidatus Obscuribacter sp.]